MKLSRIRKLIFLHLAHLPIPAKGWRSRIYKLGGRVVNPKKTFIGDSVVVDTNYPEDITIEEGVRLTSGCKIVTHFLSIQPYKYVRGNVHIKKGAYLGMNTLIVKPVTIGEGAAVGAGSVVTKDIPDYEVWAGNPAKFIRKR